MRVEIVGQERTRALRRAVLRPLTGPDDPLPGDDVTDAVHFAAVDDGRVISTCFVFLDPWPFPSPVRAETDPATGVWAGDHADHRADNHAGHRADNVHANDWHLRQMATAPDGRGRGAGSAVVEAAIAHVAARGTGLLWCHARVSALGFYERHGFTAVGAWHDAGRPPIPHKYMYRPVLAVRTPI